MIGEWQKGFEVILAKRSDRSSDTKFKRKTAYWFYYVFNFISKTKIPQNVGDFRLIDRSVINALKKLPESERFMKGLFAWVGFNSTGIKVDRAERFGGESNADTGKVIDLALKGIFAHSTIPLRLITILGLSTSIFSVISFGFLLIRLFFYGVPFSGYGILVTLNLFVLGTISLCLGVVAEYLGLVYEEVKARPNYVVSEEINL
jgi:dolichol-phosphate mannosyltransferase